MLLSWNASRDSLRQSNESIMQEPQPVPNVVGRDIMSVGGAALSNGMLADAGSVSVLGKSPGLKFDAGKAPVQRGFLDYFPRAVAAVANISAFGATKYKVAFEDQNWRKVEGGEGRYRDAKGRHSAPPPGELYAEDSKLLHAAHEAWNAMAVLELMLARGVKERNDESKQ